MKWYPENDSCGLLINVLNPQSEDSKNNFLQCTVHYQIIAPLLINEKFSNPSTVIPTPLLLNLEKLN